VLLAQRTERRRRLRLVSIERGLPSDATLVRTLSEVGSHSWNAGKERKGRAADTQELFKFSAIEDSAEYSVPKQTQQTADGAAQRPLGYK
jgi:hypothetical protein